MKPTATGAGTRVEFLRHHDTRLNIPTEELRGFVAEEESTYDTTFYPRDPSLDPQLVWRGKDQQDTSPLEVPVLPIYIQEKIHPRALIEDLKRSGAGGRVSAETQLDLFGSFSGLEDDFTKSVEFYQHDQHWSNRMILGDSLLVMNSLVEKEGMKGKVQTIYLDPPYGIKFSSNWQVSTRKQDVKDGKIDDATRQPEQVRAFRDTWKLGIHSYLAYMRDRVVVARELLTETGSIFVQIGDENVHLVRSVLDEVLGSENFCGQIVFAKTSGYDTNLVTGVVDYILWYAKSRNQVKYHQLYRPKEIGGEGVGEYRKAELPGGSVVNVDPHDSDAVKALPQGTRLFRADNITTQGNPIFEVEVEGRKFSGPYKTNPAGIKKLVAAHRVLARRDSISYKRYVDDFAAIPLNGLWADTVIAGRRGEKVYVVQTLPRVIERCILMTSDPGDLILDPTGGSGTTAIVAEERGRRWIVIDTSRVALALARTRLMTARYPFYLLADSPEGAAKEAELAGVLRGTTVTSNDVRHGFVYKRVPHVTLKSIANNPDIREGMTRAEIDAAIARHADTEVLYDQPYEDKKTIRVTGPFTVESLSPHRVLAVSDDNLDGRVSTKEAERQQDFATMILENLRKSGAQNTYANERLVFDTLEPYAGTWLQATGTYTNASGEPKRVSVSLGPEHGTVGPEQVKEAAKEAMQGAGHDILLICGFAFDPHVSEEAKRYGRLTVLPTKMNPDLAMGDELLKKTGAGNLFMVFGEPEVQITTEADGRIVAAITGLDIYDPTTGDIRSSSAGNLDYDIAAWFIDTNYDGESFFVRHAYFTGGNEPYDKLKRALRAEIDEDAWESLYSTTSRPFPRPNTGKIAIKVINHYGDEVLKVFPV
jgi:adenine-specific DNA-methyltransferase